MKRTRKLTALLTAACCLGGAMVSDLEAQAERIPYENAVNLGIIAITDGTELTETMVRNVEPSKPIDLYINYIPEASVTELLPEDWENSDSYQALKAEFGEECRIYMVSPSTPLDMYSQYGRRFMIANDCVLDIRLYQNLFSDAAIMAENLFFLPKEGLTEEELTSLEAALKADSIVTAYNTGYNAWFDAYTELVGTMGSEYLDMTEAERETAMAEACTAAGIKNAAEMRTHTENAAAQLMEKYADSLLAIDARMGIIEEPFHEKFGMSISAWSSVGDMDEDGDIDAEDASELLQFNAAQGATGALETFPEQDVNADGYVDAIDCGDILRYAALAGTGEDVDLVDVLR